MIVPTSNPLLNKHGGVLRTALRGTIRTKVKVMGKVNLARKKEEEERLKKLEQEALAAEVEEAQEHS